MDITLGDLLNKYRRLSGLSLREVEEKTGISNAYLSQLESGKAQNPSPHKLYKLAEVYGVPYDELMRAAGYVAPAGKKGKSLSAIQAAASSAGLSSEEEEQVISYIEFVRQQRAKKK